MVELLREHWVQVALALCIVGMAGVVLQAARRGLPWLFESGGGGGARISLDASGVTLVREAGTTRVRWDDVAEVRVRTTGEGPLSEDLFLELDTAGARPAMSIPSEAEGFDHLLGAVVERLAGFDMDRVIEAATCLEASEAVVWRRA